MNPSSLTRPLLSTLASLALLLGTAACSRQDNGAGRADDDKTIIQNAGSDTIVNVAQAWAEEYPAVEPAVSVEVSGGGSGTGIAALINGTVDIANCSRQIKPEEAERARNNTGEEPVETVVGYDAMAVYVHKDNPLDEISVEQLAQIYGEDGTFTAWSQLGVTLPGGAKDEIIRISRQSNSGSYHYFREAVLGKKRDFKLGSRDMHGSKDVVELVANTPGAIGYSGMGYRTDQVKVLRIAQNAEEPAREPTVAAALDGSYPLARPLMMYTLGPPTGPVKQYLDWILSPTGQKILQDCGYVPLAATSEPANN